MVFKWVPGSLFIYFSCITTDSLKCGRIYSVLVDLCLLLSFLANRLYTKDLPFRVSQKHVDPKRITVISVPLNVFYASVYLYWFLRHSELSSLLTSSACVDFQMQELAERARQANKVGSAAPYSVYLLHLAHLCWVLCIDSSNVCTLGLIQCYSLLYQLFLIA